MGFSSSMLRGNDEVEPQCVCVCLCVCVCVCVCVCWSCISKAWGAGSGFAWQRWESIPPALPPHFSSPYFQEMIPWLWHWCRHWKECLSFFLFIIILKCSEVCQRKETEDNSALMPAGDQSSESRGANGNYNEEDVHIAGQRRTQGQIDVSFQPNVRHMQKLLLFNCHFNPMSTHHQAHVIHWSSAAPPPMIPRSTLFYFQFLMDLSPKFQFFCQKLRKGYFVRILFLVVYMNINTNNINRFRSRFQFQTQSFILITQ